MVQWSPQDVHLHMFMSFIYIDAKITLLKALPAAAFEYIQVGNDLSVIFNHQNDDLMTAM